MIVEWIQRVFVEALKVLGASAPYLLIGFTLAGLMKSFLSSAWITRRLGRDSTGSVIWASLYGVPLPLCSCSVIPTAMTLRESGASKSATTSFLISTPETGVDSILISYGLLGPFMAVVRPVAAFLTAMTAGVLVALGVRRGWVDASDSESEADETPHCSHHQHHQDHANDHSGEETSIAQEHGRGRRMLDGLRYGFGSLLDDLTPWLLLGFLLSGAIVAFLPESLFQDFVPQGWLSSLVMMLLGTPLYICATASTPVAAALMAKGLDPGAALVFLLVGPATNMTTLLVVFRFLGRRVLLIYVSVIVLLALGIGAIVNAIVASTGIELAPLNPESMAHGTGLLESVCGVILGVLMLFSARRISLMQQWGRGLNRLTQPIGIDLFATRTKWVAVLIGLILYAQSAWTRIHPGETGWVLRFGEIVRGPISEEGLYGHAPFPFETVYKVETKRTRRVVLGDRQGLSGGKSREQIIAEAEVLTGEGHLLSIAIAVHFRVKDAAQTAFGVRDAKRLVSHLTESALRRVTATENGMSLLVSTRGVIAPRVHSILQSELETLQTGLDVTQVNVLSVHAPEAVHFEYRDVASALVEYEEKRHRAQGTADEFLMRGEARAFEVVERARRQAQAIESAASAESERFLQMADVFSDHREVAAKSSFYRTLVDFMGKLRKLFLVGSDIQVRTIQGGSRLRVPPSLIQQSDEESDLGEIFDNFEFDEDSK